MTGDAQGRRGAVLMGRENNHSHLSKDTYHTTEQNHNNTPNTEQEAWKY